LIHDPPVLILDEPTIGLDPYRPREVRELVRRLSKEGRAHIVHEPQSLGGGGGL
jgi:ABC-type multidrug transport system, ATPase component